MTPAYSRMSFTSGGLFISESVEMAELYVSLQDWKSVRAKVIDDNLLHTRTRKSAMRMSLEILLRLQQLSETERLTLIEASSHDQGYLLWISVCRTYRFIGEFATEVLRERFLRFQNTLEPQHVDQFLDRKAEWHPELLQIKSSTREKLRQNLLKMLREAQLLSAEGLILPPIFSREVLERYAPQLLKEILYFPMFESDLKLAYKQ